MYQLKNLPSFQRAVLPLILKHPLLTLWGREVGNYSASFAEYGFSGLFLAASFGLSFLLQTTSLGFSGLCDRGCLLGQQFDSLPHAFRHAATVDIGEVAQQRSDILCETAVYDSPLKSRISIRIAAAIFCHDTSRWDVECYI